MSEITNDAELEFLQSQWNNQSMPLPRANKTDVLVTDPLELSELREEATADENWLEDAMMSSRAILDGTFWGWSDEVAASIAAAAYQTFLKPEESNVQIPQEMLDRQGMQPEATSSYFDVRRGMMTEL